MVSLKVLSHSGLFSTPCMLRNLSLLFPTFHMPSICWYFQYYVYSSPFTIFLFTILSLCVCVFLLLPCYNGTSSLRTSMFHFTLHCPDWLGNCNKLRGRKKLETRSGWTVTFPATRPRIQTLHTNTTEENPRGNTDPATLHCYATVIECAAMSQTEDSGPPGVAS